MEGIAGKVLTGQELSGSTAAVLLRMAVRRATKVLVGVPVFTWHSRSASKCVALLFPGKLFERDITLEQFSHTDCISEKMGIHSKLRPTTQLLLTASAFQ